MTSEVAVSGGNIYATAVLNNGVASAVSSLFVPTVESVLDDIGAKNQPRLLLLNKVDLLPPAEAEALCKDIVRRLRWKGPLFKISAATGAGTRELCEALMRRIEEKAADEAAAGAETP